MAKAKRTAKQLAALDDGREWMKFARWERNLTGSEGAERYHNFMVCTCEAYKRRKRSDKWRNTCHHYGYWHLDELDELWPAHIAEYPDWPYVPTFWQLSNSLAEVGEYDEAIRLCVAAIDFGIVDGSVTGWTGRIRRIEQRRKRCG